MPGYTQTYDRNTGLTALDGSKYNPVRTEYYTSADELIRIEEVSGNSKSYQTISGSDFASNWPTYDYTITYSVWEETTVS